MELVRTWQAGLKVLRAVAKTPASRDMCGFGFELVRFSFCLLAFCHRFHVGNLSFALFCPPRRSFFVANEL